MAKGIERLDKQLDRLEKLFSRRKRSAEPHDAPTFGNRPATPIPILPELNETSRIFPQPSFIRPTSSRMVAREEVLLTPNSARRARSLPESPSAPRLTTLVPPTDCRSQPRCESTEQCSPKSKQPSSIHRVQGMDDDLSELMGFSFPTVPKENVASSHQDRRCRPRSRSMLRSASKSVSPKAQGIRKRYSAGAEHALSGVQQQEVGHRESYCFPAALSPHLVPSSSPMLDPLPQPGPDELRQDNGRMPERPASPPVSGSDIKRMRAALRKASRSSKGSATKRPSQDPILKEPSVRDFLALSDDDIADGHAALRSSKPLSSPPKCALPPNPVPTFTPCPAKATPPLLTLSPPLASKPATAAAFEAARIASKYRFDLVYVVNLWPLRMSKISRLSPLSRLCGTPVATSPARTATPSPPTTPVSYTSGDENGFEGRMASPHGGLRGGITGRLLAAYGLPSIMYPFRISAPVHQKVLRADGWLEYRNETGSTDEFVRGYSCSFYTGYSPALGHDADTAVVTTPGGKRRKLKAPPPNRGIVFAAFRLRCSDGTPVGIDGEELDALHRDAEALVDMLIDIHMTQRRRQPPPPTTPLRCVSGPSGQMMGSGSPLVST